MILMSRLNIIFSSQNSPIDGTTDRFNEQHALLSLRDLWAVVCAVPYRPDVFDCIMLVIVIKLGDPPLTGLKTKQVSGMFMCSLFERSQHQLRSDLSVARMPLVVFVNPNCFTEATPTDGESV